MKKGIIVSTHTLAKGRDLKGRIKTLIIGWSIFIALFALSKYPPLQTSLLSFALKMSVPWVSSCVNFIVNGLWIVFIPMVIGTFITLFAKQPFDSIVIYEEGLGFLNSKTEKECYVPFSHIDLSIGKFNDSFWITAKDADLKNREYVWKEFSDSDTMSQNLKKLTIIHPY